MGIRGDLRELIVLSKFQRTNMMTGPSQASFESEIEVGEGAQPDIGKDMVRTPSINPFTSGSQFDWVDWIPPPHRFHPTSLGTRRVEVLGD